MTDSQLVGMQLSQLVAVNWLGMRLSQLVRSQLVGMQLSQLVQLVQRLVLRPSTIHRALVDCPLFSVRRLHQQSTVPWLIVPLVSAALCFIGALCLGIVLNDSL
jgi:hypothetical protein